MARDFHDGQVDLDAACKIPISLGDSLRIGFARAGDVLLTHKGSIGLVAIVPSIADYVMLTPQVTYYRTNPNLLLNTYLRYAFKAPHFRDQLKSFSAQSTRPYIGITAQKELHLDVPSLPIQRRIASILSAYDDLIENSQRRIKILESMARALYREWFVHFRFPGHENHPRVASPLGEIPEGWEVLAVEEVVKRIRVGKKYDQKTVSPTGTVPVFDQGKSGVIGYHNDDPDVVASETAPVIVFANHTCYQRLVHFPFSAIQNVLPFIPAPTLRRNIYWLHWATNGLVAFNDYKGHWPEFAAMSLVVPPAELCERFGDLVAPLSLQNVKQERRIQNLRRTRDLLLPRLLSGQIALDELEAA